MKVFSSLKDDFETNDENRPPNRRKKENRITKSKASIGLRINSRERNATVAVSNNELENTSILGILQRTAPFRGVAVTATHRKEMGIEDIKYAKENTATKSIDNPLLCIMEMKRNSRISAPSRSKKQNENCQSKQDGVSKDTKEQEKTKSMDKKPSKKSIFASKKEFQVSVKKKKSSFKTTNKDNRKKKVLTAICESRSYTIDTNCAAAMIDQESDHHSPSGFDPKRSRTISRARISPRADGDTWIEALAVSDDGKNGKVRSYFYSKKTKGRIWDEPPSGASNIVYVTPSVREMTRMQLKSMVELRKANMEAEVTPGGRFMPFNPDSETPQGKVEAAMEASYQKNNHMETTCHNFSIPYSGFYYPISTPKTKAEANEPEASHPPPPEQEEDELDNVLVENSNSKNQDVQAEERSRKEAERHLAEIVSLAISANVDVEDEKPQATDVATSMESKGDITFAPEAMVNFLSTSPSEKSSLFDFKYPEVSGKFPSMLTEKVSTESSRSDATNASFLPVVAPNKSRKPLSYVGEQFFKILSGSRKTNTAESTETQLNRVKQKNCSLSYEKMEKLSDQSLNTPLNSNTSLSCISGTSSTVKNDPQSMPTKKPSVAGCMRSVQFFLDRDDEFTSDNTVFQKDSLTDFSTTEIGLIGSSTSGSCCIGGKLTFPTPEKSKTVQELIGNFEVVNSSGRFQSLPEKKKLLMSLPELEDYNDQHKIEEGIDDPKKEEQEA